MNPVSMIRRQLTARDLERMNLPPSLWRLRIDGVSEEVRPLMSRYLAKICEAVQKGVGVTLCGEAGTGKSGIASLIAREARAWGFTVYWTGVWEVREGIRSRLMFDEDVSLLDRCRQVDVLVLDGLSEHDKDSFGPKNSGIEVVEQLLRYRAQHQKVTILTANMESELLRKNFYALTEITVGAGVVVELRGANRHVARQERLTQELLEA